MAARVLDNDAIFKRIAALDALYLNADRRRDEWLALADTVSAATWTRYYARYKAAQRAYIQLRDTPYVIAPQEPTL